MHPLKHCVYVLLSLKDAKFYTGYTTDLPARLKDHNEGRTTSTAKRRPFRLVFSEFYLSKEDALRRERYFKTTAGKRVLRLMLKVSLRQVALA